MYRTHSTWLDYQIDELRIEAESRARRCNQVAAFAFLAAVASFCAGIHWHAAASAALGAAGFWSTLLFGGICAVTWFFGRVERDVLEVLPSTERLIRRTEPAQKHRHS
jgi:hypothetical protein